MRLVRARKALCLALALAVTFLLSPVALAAPAGGDFRPDAQLADESVICANPGNGPWGSVVTAFDDPSPVALQHRGDRDRHHCERARHHCREQCRHHEGGHHHNCVRHCLRERGCHHD